MYYYHRSMVRGSHPTACDTPQLVRSFRPRPRARGGALEATLRPAQLPADVPPRAGALAFPHGLAAKRRKAVAWGVSPRCLFRWHVRKPRRGDMADPIGCRPAGLAKDLGCSCPGAYAPEASAKLGISEPVELLLNDLQVVPLLSTPATPRHNGACELKKVPTPGSPPRRTALPTTCPSAGAGRSTGTGRINRAGRIAWLFQTSWWRHCRVCGGRSGRGFDFDKEGVLDYSLPLPLEQPLRVSFRNSEG
jgi:hypothetical protein